MLIIIIALNAYFLTLPDSTSVKVLSTFATVTVSMNLAFTVVVTLLIVGRILIVRRRHIRAMGK
jgi:hypothetical protein